MQVKYLHYLLLSALVSAVLGFTIQELVFRMDEVAFVEHRFLGISIITIIVVILGTYAGLWRIGKIRKPSFAFGILVGLLTFMFYLLIYTLGGWFALEFEGATEVFFQLGWISFLYGFLGRVYALVYIITSLVGAILGATLVRFASPSFCPNCGNKLPLGNEPCSKCGTSNF